MVASTTTRVLAPLSGRIVLLTDVPDPVFANGVVGHGVAIDPPRAVVEVVAPISGTVKALFPHAFVLCSPDGVNVLVHLGLDTVQLAGDGFMVHATKGAEISAGSPLVTYDVPRVEASGRSPIVPVVFLEQHPDSIQLVANVGPGSDIKCGEPFLSLAQ